MLSPGAKGRFRTAATHIIELKRISSSVPHYSPEREKDHSLDSFDSPSTSPKTPVILRKIPENSIERVKRLPCGASGCKIWIARVDGWSCCLKEIILKNSVKREVDEFEKEVNVLSTLAKPLNGRTNNLVNFLGCQRTAKSLQLFMTLYEGNLSQVITRLRLFEQPLWLDEKRLARYVLQLLNGLNILHNRNIIHRDIKSPNIFYTALERWNGTPRFQSSRNGILPENLVLGDFGEAKILNLDSRAKTCRGTPSWIAPEVFEVASNKLEYTLAADIWSLGMVVYEMMSLKMPYDDISPLRIICCIQQGELPVLDNKSCDRYPRVSKLWHMMVKRNPKERANVGLLLSLFSQITNEPVVPLPFPTIKAKIEELEEIESSDQEEESSNDEESEEII